MIIYAKPSKRTWRIGRLDARILTIREKEVVFCVVMRELRIGGIEMCEPTKGDWKKFREKLPCWQERYMETLVKE